MFQLMKNLFQTGRYSDFTITCKGHQFRVHQAIVCSQCLFFDAAICGHFQVGSTSYCTVLLLALEQKASEEIVYLPDDDGDTVRRLISYLYLQDYGGTWGSLTHHELDETVKADPSTREASPSETNLTKTPRDKESFGCQV